MKRILLILIILAAATGATAQNRYIARGAEPGELYISGGWYGTYDKVYGAPYYDTLRTAIFRLTENGKKLTIQYDDDALVGNPDEMSSGIILADATPGVVYCKNYYGKNDSYSYTSLWVSFDYGKYWTFREENIGQLFYYVADFEGLIYRGGGGEVSKSIDNGNTWQKIKDQGYSLNGECGLDSCELFGITGSSIPWNLYHTYNWFDSYDTIPIDTQFVGGSVGYDTPDVYRGGLPGEVYISSWFPDWTYKASFSADTGHTFRQVFVSEPDPLVANNYGINFMSDRESGVFYIVRGYTVYEGEGFNLKGHHIKICVDYYRDYGDTFVDTYCHELTKDYGNEVGIAETEEEEGIVVYPNPTSGVLRVTSYELRVTGIEIFDLMGKNVLSQKAESGRQKELDISHLPSGMYFVRVMTEQGIINRKIVKY
ncbi:MAG: T9SS type A sorting domain-containing protein [Bacteroidales bacterium]|nr:T9SS type A sorting domain-containing protein [Bacteroidales bacterium]